MILLGFPPVWGWLGLGLVLIAAEVLAAPGTYLLFVGIAAVAVAVISAFVPMGGGTELVVFGLLALVSGGIGWKIYGARVENDAARDLHDPAVTLVGRVLTLSTAIADGVGQVRMDDTVWRVAGPDLPAGSKVRIKALDGATLLVEPA